MRKRDVLRRKFRVNILREESYREREVGKERFVRDLRR